MYKIEDYFNRDAEHLYIIKRDSLANFLGLSGESLKYLIRDVNNKPPQLLHPELRPVQGKMLEQDISLGQALFLIKYFCYFHKRTAKKAKQDNYQHLCSLLAQEKINTEEVLAAFLCKKKQPADWLEKIRRHYYLTVGSNYTAKIVEPKLAKEITYLRELQITNLLIPGKIYSSKDLEEWKIIFKQKYHELDLQAFLGIKGGNPRLFLLAQQVLNKLGVGLTFVGQKYVTGLGSNKVRTYQYFPPCDKRELYFSNWLKEEEETKGEMVIASKTVAPLGYHNQTLSNRLKLLHDNIAYLKQNEALTAQDYLNIESTIAKIEDLCELTKTKVIFRQDSERLITMLDEREKEDSNSIEATTPNLVTA